MDILSRCHTSLASNPGRHYTCNDNGEGQHYHGLRAEALQPMGQAAAVGGSLAHHRPPAEEGPSFSQKCIVED
jgi:hypothetical protein